jgi:hypothetical protein
MNALQRNDMAVDAVLSNDRPDRLSGSARLLWCFCEVIFVNLFIKFSCIVNIA